MPKFAKGHAKVGGRRKGAPNHNTVRERKLISEAADRAIVDQVVRDARNGDHSARAHYFRYLRPAPPRPATFAPKPFEFRKLATLEEAAAETLRIAAAIAGGELDHDTGASLVGVIKVFIEAQAAVKTEREIALADAALKQKAGNP